MPRFRNQPIVVVGGGDTAVEEATYLTKFASNVYMVHRRDVLRASKIMQERALNNPKITMKWNRALHEVLGTDKAGVTGAMLKSTVDDSNEQLEAGGVFLAIGHTPNTDFLGGQLKLDAKGYIALTVPFRTNTSVKGFSRRATWPTAIIARQLRRQAPAAWRRSTSSAGWRNKGTLEPACGLAARSA